MKWEISNGNILIWLGNQPIHGCKDVLILSGGNVVFLKPEKEEIATKLKNDIETLDKVTFLNLYGWPNNSSGNELYAELKEFYAHRFEYSKPD